MTAYPNFCGPSYQAQSLFSDCERLINFYVEQAEMQGQRSQYTLYPTPGVAAYGAAAATGARGMLEQSGRAWAVVGKVPFELFAGGATTARGTMLLDANPATLTTNGDGGDQVFITSGSEGYILDKTTHALTPVVAGAHFGGMVDGFFIRLDALTSTVGISNEFDGLTWDGTQITQRSAASDPWIGMFISNKKIFLFGEETSDVWYNKGAPNFPFAPIADALIPYGIGAPFSAAELNGAVLWVSQSIRGSYQVVMANSYSSALRVSTYAVEKAMKNYPRVSDAWAFTYSELGHDFYVLNFPTANASWVYDPAGGWSERGTWNIAQNRYDVWRPCCHMSAFGEHLVGDPNSGTIYRMSTDLGFDVDGGPIRRERVAPSLGRDKRRSGRVSPVIVNRFSVDLEPGLALISGQGSNPAILFAKSKDGGKTFGNYRTRNVGAIGTYRSTQPWWGRVGAALDFAPKIVVTDPVPWRITGADIQVAA